MNRASLCVAAALIFNGNWFEVLGTSAKERNVGGGSVRKEPNCGVFR